MFTSFGVQVVLLFIVVVFFKVLVEVLLTTGFECTILY